MDLCLGMIARFRLGGRHVADRFEQAAVIEPINPFEGGVFHCLEGSPRPAPIDHLSFEQADHRLGESVDAPISVKPESRLLRRLEDGRRDG